MILKIYNSKFVTYELVPGIYSNKDISEAVYTIGDHEGTLKIGYDDFSMKTKLTLKRFGGTFGTLRFDEKSFFSTLLCFTPYWAYKPTNAFHSDSPDKYASDKLLYLNKINKIHLQRDVIDGSVPNAVRQAILFWFYIRQTSKL